jgi:hypothetical protein
MYDPYIIAFASGTSGRFISYIVRSILSNNAEDFLITEQNSAHLYKSNFGTIFNNTSVNADEIYEKIDFNFDEPIKILTSHTFPQIDIINKRFSKTKIIVITYEMSDLLEIAGNNFFKNALGDNHISEVVDNSSRILESMIEKIFLRKIPKENLTQRQVQQIIETMRGWAIKNISLRFEDGLFYRPNVDILYEHLLILPYNEIYDKTKTGEYIGLQKLEDFMGFRANDITRKNYEKYVKGQENLISTKMPWILKNDIENSNN